MADRSGMAGGWRGTVAPGTVHADGEEPELVVVRADPFNAEAPVGILGEASTPSKLFYVRSHFPTPVLEAASWRLRVEGPAARRLDLTFDELRALPDRTVVATLECAGNDRVGFAPMVPGEPWGPGAVSTARWRGVSLASLLNRVDLADATVEVLFEGADQGQAGGSSSTRFARALPLEKALDPDTILAYEINGQPLPAEHGGPVRLIVPDWYGVASVKWLVRVAAIERPFDGYFQVQRYVLDRPGHEPEPLRAMLVKSLITNLQTGSTLEPGTHVVRGVAWSGDGPIARVDVSVGGEGAWWPARLVGEAPPHAWQCWEFDWEALIPGRHLLRVRATDGRGNIQPDIAAWNRLGYANNAIQVIAVEVRSGG